MNHTSVAIICSAALSATSFAAVSVTGHYQLGEAGSVGASVPFTPLNDSVGSNHITNFQNANGGSEAIITNGLAAPGSTAALQIVNGSNASGWFSSSTYGYTSDFAFDIYLRPDTFDGDNDIALGTNGNSTNALTIGFTSSGEWVLTNASDLINDPDRIQGGSAALGAWSKLSVISYAGTVYFYVDGTEIGNTTGLASEFDAPRLGFSSGAFNGADVSFDEFTVYKFDSSVDSLDSVQEFMSVPEPSATALLGLGAIGLFLRRRR
ncbi:hypothetical protein NT6N_39390 [Oceaniferula spumae]|uniref:Ice-binding protein C-terminal domain-containing protein n=1 Tax=Oceaniferula spumae TaxID=2979115 RepID=A0AAT9FSN0_9BACT